MRVPGGKGVTGKVREGGRGSHGLNCITTSYFTGSNTRYAWEVRGVEGGHRGSLSAWMGVTWEVRVDGRGVTGT